MPGPQVADQVERAHLFGGVPIGEQLTQIGPLTAVRGVGHREHEHAPGVAGRGDPGRHPGDQCEGHEDRSDAGERQAHPDRAEQGREQAEHAAHQLERPDLAAQDGPLELVVELRVLEVGQLRRSGRRHDLAVGEGGDQLTGHSLLRRGQRREQGQYGGDHAERQRRRQQRAQVTTGIAGGQCFGEQLVARYQLSAEAEAGDHLEQRDPGALPARRTPHHPGGQRHHPRQPGPVLLLVLVGLVAKDGPEVQRRLREGLLFLFFFVVIFVRGGCRGSGHPLGEEGGDVRWQAGGEHGGGRWRRRGLLVEDPFQGIV